MKAWPGKVVGILVALAIAAAAIIFYNRAATDREVRSQLIQKLDTAWVDTYAGLVANPATKCQHSLVFTSGDQSFYVARYVGPNGPFLLRQKIIRGTTDTVLNNYFFDRGRLLLKSELVKPVNPGEIFSETRTYYTNLKSIYATTRSAFSNDELQQTVFRKITPPAGDIAGELRQLEMALARKGNFDLVFEGVAETPAAKYLTLSRTGFSDYRAFIRVKKEDDFTRELSTTPMKHRGSRLNLKWAIVNDEAVYRSGSLR